MSIHIENPFNAKHVTLIRTVLRGKGKGTEDDLFRLLIQYWDFDGNLIFSYDPVTKETTVTESLL